MKRLCAGPELNRGVNRTAQVLIALLLALCVWAGLGDRALAAPVAQAVTGTITNTVRVGSTTFDPNLTNNTAQQVTTVHGADLPTPTVTPTATPTVTPTVTLVPTETATPAPTATATPTVTSTPSATVTATATPSATPSSTATATDSPTATATTAATATSSLTPTVVMTTTVTATASPVATLSATATALVTSTVTATQLPPATATPTATALVTATVTASPTVVLTPTASATATASLTPSSTVTVTATPALTPTASATVTPSLTVVPTATVTATALPTPTVPATVTPSATSVATPTPSATPSATSSVTVTATATPSATMLPTATATATPTLTPLPTATVTATALPTPTATPVPTATPTLTATITPLPTLTPSATSTPASQIGDLVWFDRDGNGVQDGGESGLANVRVALYRADGQLVGETMTDVNGFYRFTGLPVGDYYLQVAPPQQAGVTFRFSPADQGDQTGGGALDSDITAATGQSPILRLAEGQSDLGWDVGFYGAMQLGSLVWHDRNNNGAVDADEGGLPDVTVQLFRAGDDPTTATPVATTVTNSSGNYRFVDLPPGQYLVYLPLPPATYGVSSTPTDSADNGEVNDDNGSQDLVGGPVRSPIITLGLYSESTADGDDANSDQSVDFGFFAYTTVGDRLWYDQNRDGRQDASEAVATVGATGIADVEVMLYDGVTNGLVATTTTASQGYYQFSALLPGTYYLHFDLPPDYQATVGNVATVEDSLDSDPDPTTLNTGLITLTSGENNSTVDLGVRFADDRETAALGDLLWLDRNGNGLQESDEGGIAGVTLTLYHADGSLAATTVTDQAGNYLFTNLAPGNYYLTVTPPAGYTLAPPNQGDPAATEGLDSDVDPATGRSALITLGVGQYDDRWDVGLTAPATAALNGYVWLDNDMDGLQGATEAPVPGVTVALYASNGALVGTTVTDANGHYSFTNLPPGDYYLLFTAPAGFTGTLNDQGGDDSHDSDVVTDPDGLTGRTPGITLAPGENQSSWDYGLHSTAPAQLGNWLWLDANEDGIQDGGEPGVAGVTIRLYNAQGAVIGETVSDPSGNYSFADLPAGIYSLEVVLPDGYLFSPQGFTSGSDVDSNVDPATGRSPPITLYLGSNDPTWDIGLHRRPTALDQAAEPGKVRVFLPLIGRTGIKIKPIKTIEHIPLLQCHVRICLRP